MSKPSRTELCLVVALVIIVALVAILVVRPAKTVDVSPETTTTVPCASKKLATDFQIDQCLTSKITSVTMRMDSSLRRESVYFRYATRAQDWRVAQRTQATFLTYAHRECLAQTNPYQTGTIVSILYGECVLYLFDQRLHYIDHMVTEFKQGGEAQRSSTLSQPA